ncbi:MAG: M20/M25/M40 family metallo-hydrolase, partial [Thermoanaerobaculia bacterium]
GVAPNVLAPEAWADLVARVVLPLEETERRIEAALFPDGAGSGGALRLEVFTRMPPTRTAAFEGLAETVVSFGTDIPFLKDVGTPYLLGPGDILDAHTEGEKVARRELLAAAAIYERMVRGLLARS